MLDTIVVNTNLYALTKDADIAGKQWQKINRKELIIWIALVIYQGLFKSPSLDQYWNEDPKSPIHHISNFQINGLYLETISLNGESGGKHVDGAPGWRAKNF